MVDDQNRDEYDRWLRQGERDLAAASSNAGAGFHEWACFLSQQAAEKALKALLYRNGERAVVGHSILGLIRRVSSYVPEMASLHEAKRLDEVYIPSRYPNGLEDTIPGDFYTQEDSKQCIALARRVIEHAKRHAAT